MSFNHPQTDPDMPLEGWLVVGAIVVLVFGLFCHSLSKAKTVPSFGR